MIASCSTRGYIARVLVSNRISGIVSPLSLRVRGSIVSRCISLPSNSFYGKQLHSLYAMYGCISSPKFCCYTDGHCWEENGQCLFIGQSCPGNGLAGLCPAPNSTCCVTEGKLDTLTPAQQHHRCRCTPLNTLLHDCMVIGECVAQQLGFQVQCTIDDCCFCNRVSSRHDNTRKRRSHVFYLS